MRRRDDRGAVAVISALVICFVLLGVSALVIDLGLTRDARRQAQIAADASALAAANVLYLSSTPDFDAAVDAAHEYAAANLGVTAGQWADCTDPGALAYVPPGSGSCVSFDDANEPTRVRVRTPLTSREASFAPVFGVERISVTAAAVAGIERGLPCALCVLDPVTHTLTGNARIDVPDAPIHANGHLQLTGNATVTATAITVEGSATTTGNARFVPSAVPDSGRMTDPLASLSLPPSTAGLASRTDPCTQGPGIYGAVSRSGNSSCTLSPGLYVIHGDWRISGNASMTGTGVTLYFTCVTTSGPVAPRECGSGETGGELDASGNGVFEVSAPSSGSLAGLALVSDRANRGTLSLTGNGSGGVAGTIYAADGALTMTGNGCGATYDSAIVVGRVSLTGNACLDVAYVETDNYLPPAGLALFE